MKGENERLLFEILNEAYPHQWEMEHKGLKNVVGINKKGNEYHRKFSFDCANPTQKIAIEIEGGVWLGRNGGHTGGSGYESNMEKYNLAVLEGWKLLRYAPSTLKKHPERIVLDVMKLTESNPESITTSNGIRAKITQKETLQVKLS